MYLCLLHIPPAFSEEGLNTGFYEDKDRDDYLWVQYLKHKFRKIWL